MSADPPKTDPTALSERTKNLATLGSLFSNVIGPIAGTAVFILFGIHANWLLGGLFLVSVLIILGFKYFIQPVSRSTQEAIEKIQPGGIPTNEERQQVADHLKRMELRYKYALC